MTFKTLAVVLLVAMGLFTAFYWLTDASRREATFEEQQAELVALGKEYFGPDNETFNVNVSAAGFDPATITIPENATIGLVNTAGQDLEATGTGAHPFALPIPSGTTGTARFQSLGVTTVTIDGVPGSLEVTAGPEFLNPAAANCARCHGPDGMGGPIGTTGVIAPNLHSRGLALKWQTTGGAVAGDGQPAILDNYVNKVIRFGGVVVSGNVKSVMPAWDPEAGGVLTKEQIDALTALVGTWAAETLANPVAETPNTVAAGQQVYTEAQCVTCHGGALEGVSGPNLQTIGSAPVTDLPTPISGLDKLVSDYQSDPRMMLELWIRDSATNYNGGVGTGMPPHPEGSLSESALQALITFLLDQTQ